MGTIQCTRTPIVILILIRTMGKSGDILRWSRAFAKAKASKPPKPEKLSSYTNFSLATQWAPFDCQTQLLCREAMLPLMQRNPELLAPEADAQGAVRFSPEGN